MEVIIHPKSDVEVGDLFKVVTIHEDRLDAATMKRVRTMIIEKLSLENMGLQGEKK